MTEGEENLSAMLFYMPFIHQKKNNNPPTLTVKVSSNFLLCNGASILINSV